MPRKDYELIFNALTLQQGKAVAQVPICRIPAQLKPDHEHFERETDFSDHMCNYYSSPWWLNKEVGWPVWIPMCWSQDRLISLNPHAGPTCPRTTAKKVGMGWTLLGDLRPGSPGKDCITQTCVTQMETHGPFLRQCVLSSLLHCPSTWNLWLSTEMNPAFIS